MILDFARGDTPAELDADLCIVGAGAAGIALALEFANTRMTVVLLESGGERPEADTQRLYDAELRGLPCSTVHDGRARVFGGTTTLWAGQAMELSETDFAVREWVANSGWPLSLTQLRALLPPRRAADAPARVLLRRARLAGGAADAAVGRRDRADASRPSAQRRTSPARTATSSPARRT